MYENINKIKELRSEQRDIKPLLNSPNEGIREAAKKRHTELGLEIDAQLLRQERRVFSII